MYVYIDVCIYVCACVKRFMQYLHKYVYICICIFVEKCCSLSHVQLSATPWTVTPGSLSMGFSRQVCWSEWSYPSPGDLPNPGIKPQSLVLQADSLLSEPPGQPYVYIHT